MWKCPKCSQKNRISTCSKCGYEKPDEPKGSISSLNFVLMAVLSIAIIVGIFMAVDSYIEFNKKMKAEETYEEFVNEADSSEELIFTEESIPEAE